MTIEPKPTPKPATPPPPTQAQSRLLKQISDASVALLLEGIDEGKARNGKSRMLLSTEGLESIRSLRAALAALEAAEVA